MFIVTDEGDSFRVGAISDNLDDMSHVASLSWLISFKFFVINGLEDCVDTLPNLGTILITIRMFPCMFFPQFVSFR